MNTGVRYLLAFSCCPWDSPGKNVGVGCHFSGGPHFVRTLYSDLSVLGSPARHGS